METLELTPHERQLMQQGMACYLDAVMSLREAQRIAVKVCTQFLTAHLPALGTAMGAHLDSASVTPMRLPKQEEQTWDGTWAMLGASLWVQDFGTVSCTLDLWRETTDPAMYATVRLNAGLHRRYTKTCELFRRHWATVPHPDDLVLEEVRSEWDLLLYHEVPMGDMEAFVPAMQAGLETCCILWQAVGGVAAIQG
jgi:hypothetical protein